MLQRLGIRGKILAVVAVPILVLVLAAGVITLGSLQDLNEARNSEELIETLDRARTLEENLQEERYATATFLHVIQDYEERLEEAYDFTETALTNIEARLQVIDQGGEEGEEDVESGVDTDAIRAQINAAIGREGGAYLVAPRSVGISEPTEESDGWVVFPSEDEISQMQSQYANAGAAVEAIEGSLPGDLGLGGPLSALAFRLNVESELSTSLFTEPLALKGDIEDASGSVDTGIQSLAGSVEQLSGAESNEQAIAALLAGEDAAAELTRIRADVRSLSVGAVGATGFYTEFINTIVDAADDVAIAMSDRELVSTVQAYGNLDQLVEQIEYEYIVIERLIRAGEFLPGEAAQARTMTAQTDIALDAAQDASQGISGVEEIPEFGTSASTVAGEAGSFNTVRAQVLTGLDASLFTARTADWPAQVREELAVYEPLREDMWDRVESRASSNAQNALVSTIVTTLAIAAVVIISVVVALVIARRIIGPLRRLTTTATAVRQELPRLVERVAIPGETVDVSEVQIPVESRDEVGLLAEAFNGVNAATLAIAGEQAALRGSISEMFVNVARRDQVLLNRQLSSIDEMERSEDNQETLTKLFALDHLATRMRRNSESLLVLAGIDTGRRLRRPMPLSDVVRTASSEIELYERVQLELDADPAMLGHSALTAAHLFAELLENATVFSDPGTPVIVRTVDRGGDFVVEIEDSGIGMTEKELADANNRVASTAASEILGAQRLGLFVVGRIARRIGAHVELRSQEGAGTLAIVTMPRALFAKDDEHPQGHVSSNAIDEATHAPAALVSHDEANEISDATRLPERSGRRVDTYAPTALQEGTSLSGRSGGEDPDSIDALIAADAANAPVAEQTNPAELTDGAASSGLPTRRRREAPSPADEQRERQSIVGLPARATDAQLSALAAEQVGGFMPAVSPSEIAPQSLEQRSSMFRGFRSRKETEQEAASATPATSFGPELPKRGAAATPSLEAQDAAAPHTADAPTGTADFAPEQAPAAGAGGSAAEAPTTAAPAPGAPSSASAPGDLRTSAGAGAAGAAGAAAFFSRRTREADEQAMQAQREAAPAFEPQFDFGAAEPAAQPAAQEVFAEPVADEPVSGGIEVPHAAYASEPEPEPAVEVQEDEAAVAQPSENDGLPVFRMPKLDVAPRPAVNIAPETPAAPEPTHAPSPVFEFDDAFDTGEVPVQKAEAGPFVVPSLEADESDAPAAAYDDGSYSPTFADDTPAPAFADEAPAFQDEPAPSTQDDYTAPQAEPAPYGGVESVSLVDDDQPQSATPYDAPPAYETPSYDAQATEQTEARPWHAQSPYAPAPVEDDAPAPGFLTGPSAPAYDAVQDAAPVEQPAVEPPAEPQAATPAAPWGFQSETPRESRDSNPSLDALIQSAVDDETEQRPGFFSRLFGRGRSNESAGRASDSPASSGMAGQWAATDARLSAPSAAPSSSGAGFTPVSHEAPAPVSWHSAPEPASAAETGRADYSAPSAPTGSIPAVFAPEPSSAPAPQPEPVNDAPWLQPRAESAPEMDQPQRWETPPWEKPRQETPDQSAYGAAPANPWEAAPTTREEQPPAAPSASAFTAEQLAKPAGWEAAGASALQAAAPEGATTYQPVIQPGSGEDGEGGADLTSAVFSELSSLAAERPKVEKTRAGLQRRRPRDAKPVEVHPIEEDVSIAPAERDADAVRNRFSSFYSGTQRARDDVASFERQTEPAEASDT